MRRESGKRRMIGDKQIGKLPCRITIAYFRHFRPWVGNERVQWSWSRSQGSSGLSVYVLPCILHQCHSTWWKRHDVTCEQTICSAIWSQGIETQEETGWEGREKTMMMLMMMMMTLTTTGLGEFPRWFPPGNFPRWIPPVNSPGNLSPVISPR